MEYTNYPSTHLEVLEPIQSTKQLDYWFVVSEHKLLHPNVIGRKQMLLGQLIWDLLQSFHALLLPKYHLHEVVNLTVCDRYPLFQKIWNCNIEEDKYITDSPIKISFSIACKIPI